MAGTTNGLVAPLRVVYGPATLVENWSAKAEFVQLKVRLWPDNEAVTGIGAGGATVMAKMPLVLIGALVVLTVKVLKSLVVNQANA